MTISCQELKPCQREITTDEIQKKIGNIQGPTDGLSATQNGQAGECFSILQE